MPTYIGLLKWTDEGIKGVKDALNRRQQATARIERMGGRMIASYWTQGAYDVVAIVEYPDEETAAASALATGMQGIVRSESLRAFTEEEMQRILQKLP
jgi:uncharacterized protein with GYD domain